MDGPPHPRYRKPLRLQALGSGSDFTPFLQHLGIASLNLGFGGEGEYGQYHSIYDSIDHFERFIDPGYLYGVAQAKLCGRTMLRLANADVLPFDFSPLAATLAEYVEQVGKLADEMCEQTAEENWRIEEGIYQAFFDPSRAFVAPGHYTGYGVKTLPAIREAIELRRWEEVDAGVEATAEVFRALSAHVDRAAAVWKGE